MRRASAPHSKQKRVEKVTGPFQGKYVGPSTGGKLVTDIPPPRRDRLGHCHNYYIVIKPPAIVVQYVCHTHQDFGVTSFVFLGPNAHESSNLTVPTAEHEVVS